MVVRINSEGFPEFIDPPSLEFILAMKPSNPDDIAQLLFWKDEWKLDSPTRLIQAKSKYLESFNLQPGSPGYQAAFNRLAEESNSNRVLLGNARRIYQQAQTVSASNGDLTQEAVYVNDSFEPCEECLALGGTQETITWFIANDSQPGDRCLGGINCKCSLLPVSKS